LLKTLKRASQGERFARGLGLSSKVAPNERSLLLQGKFSNRFRDHHLPPHHPFCMLICSENFLASPEASSSLFFVFLKTGQRDFTLAFRNESSKEDHLVSLIFFCLTLAERSEASSAKRSFVSKYLNFIFDAMLRLALFSQDYLFLYFPERINAKIAKSIYTFFKYLF